MLLRRRIRAHVLSGRWAPRALLMGVAGALVQHHPTRSVCVRRAFVLSGYASYLSAAARVHGTSTGGGKKSISATPFR